MLCRVCAFFLFSVHENFTSTLSHCLCFHFGVVSFALLPVFQLLFSIFCSFARKSELTELQNFFKIIFLIFIKKKPNKLAPQHTAYNKHGSNVYNTLAFIFRFARHSLSVLLRVFVCRSTLAVVVGTKLVVVEVRRTEEKIKPETCAAVYDEIHYRSPVRERPQMVHGIGARRTSRVWSA